LTLDGGGFSIVPLQVVRSRPSRLKRVCPKARSGRADL